MDVGIVVQSTNHGSGAKELECVVLPYEEEVACGPCLAKESRVVGGSPGIEVQLNRGSAGRQHVGLYVLGAGGANGIELAVAGRQVAVRDDLVGGGGLFARVDAAASNVDGGGADIVGIGIGQFVVDAFGKSYASIPVADDHLGKALGKRIVLYRFGVEGDFKWSKDRIVIVMALSSCGESAGLGQRRRVVADVDECRRAVCVLARHEVVDEIARPPDLEGVELVLAVVAQVRIDSAVMRGEKRQDAAGGEGIRRRRLRLQHRPVGGIGDRIVLGRDRVLRLCSDREVRN